MVSDLLTIHDSLNNSADIDECSEGLDMCASNATCTNTEGGYNCSCDFGYHGDGFTCNSKCVMIKKQILVASVTVS